MRMWCLRILPLVYAISSWPLSESDAVAGVREHFQDLTRHLNESSLAIWFRVMRQGGIVGVGAPPKNF